MNYHVEWHLTPAELAAIFAMKGWLYENPDPKTRRKQPCIQPSGDDLLDMIGNLVSVVENADQENVYTTRGRFLVYQDPEFPDSYDIYFHIGFVWKACDDEEGVAA